MFDRIKLVEAMRAQGMSPTELAAAAELSRPSMWAILVGKSTPRNRTAKRLADALGLDVLTLWTDEARP